MQHAPDSVSWGNDAFNYAVNAAADSAYSSGYGPTGINEISKQYGGDIDDHLTHENGSCYEAINKGVEECFLFQSFFE